MIELRKHGNLLEKISNRILHSREKQKKHTASNDTLNVRILTQEKDGSILFTWDDTLHGTVSTHFGVYDPGPNTYEVVHVYSRKVHVVSCSINKERTLMAFTTVTRERSSTDRRSGTEKYTAYLAEIKVPNSRVFSLNLERSTFMKVQFLYEETPSDKESQMLIMLHKESIGLYRIKLARVDKGMVMRGQPHTEQVCRKFVWCQWDSGNQQLFYVHCRKDAQGDKQALLSCVQFYSNGNHENVIDILLNFPFASKSSGRYDDIAFHNGIPDPSINMCVLTQSTGTFCICYQHHVHSERRSKSCSPLPRTSPLQRSSPHPTSGQQVSPTDSDGDNTDINYYICMVHHAKTLHGCVSCLPSNIIRKAVLNFSWFGDTVMVMLPGYFVHILNIGIEFDPCNHIFLHYKTCAGKEPSQEEPDMQTASKSAADDTLVTSTDTTSPLPVLSLMAEHLVFYSNVTVSHHGKDNASSYVLEKWTGDMYKVCLNTSSLVQMFTESYMPMTRSALLHYAILRTRDFVLLKKLFQVLYNDVTSPEVPSLITEFLIAMTYGGMRRQIDRELLRLLPFTSAEPFRGQFDKAPDGDRLARVSYSSIYRVNIATKMARERQQRKGVAMEDMLDQLREHLRWKQISVTRRFQLAQVKKANKSRNGKDEKERQKKEEESFLTQARMQRAKPPHSSDFSPDVSGGYGSKSDSILGVAPSFLAGNSITDYSEGIMMLTREILTKHLSMYLQKESKVKATNVSKEYTICQAQQSRLLCHLLWSLRGSPTAEQGPNCVTSLTGETTLEEYELFQMMERYSLAVTEVAFPLPQGFPSFHTTLAFKCLGIREFIQYVDCGVVQLTGDFMMRLLTELPNEDKTVKQYIISRLPLVCAEECYRQWGNMTCTAYLAHQHVSSLIQKQEQRNSESSGSQRMKSTGNESRNSQLDKITFQPLAAFLRHLHVQDPPSPSVGRSSPLDVLALEEVALYHTTHETDYDMGTVNF